MAQVPCSECKCQFGCIKSLFIHFKFFHESITRYKCTVCDLKRVYDNWDSLKKHLIRSHAVPMHGSVEGNTTVSQASGPNVFEPTEVDSSSLNISDVPSNISEQQFSLEKLRNELHNAADNLVAKLLSTPGLPRCFADVLISDVTSFLSGNFMQIFQDITVKSLSEEDVKKKVGDAFRHLSSPFKHLSSDYLRLKYFKNCGDYIPPKTFDIAKRPERVTTKQGIQWEMRSVTGQYIPVGQVLSKFLALPQVLSASLDYIKSVKKGDNILYSFLQSEVWERKMSRYKDDELVFPIMPYYDDFQPNADLGPHGEALGAVYLHLPFLPLECQSKLENIFLALLFNSDDRKVYGNRRVFGPLIKELCMLENEGVLVNAPEGQVRVYFVTGLLLGDNLGLNGMCGFVESFTSNHPCRVCRVPYSILQRQVEEDPSLLRTKENYLHDVEQGNFSETGVKEMCVFEEIPSFETPTDIAVDCFHDLEEGVSHYVMIEVVLHFQRLNSEFIETLNNRMYMIDLGVDKDNRPGSILWETVREKRKLKMTGAEMLTFVRIFGVLVVDLIPENDDYYEMYLLLHDIVSISHAKFLPREAGDIMKVLVKELNLHYIELTGKPLKAKFHLLLHYGRLLERFGSIASLSTIRMEAKHRILSLISKSCFTRKNLPKTVAIKCQLDLCYRLTCKQPLISAPVCGSGQICNLKEHGHYKSFKSSLPDIYMTDSSAYCAKWVEYKGTTYKLKNVLIYDYLYSGCPDFCEIELILPVGSSVYFVCSPLFTVGYFSEVRGYEIERYHPASQNWFCIKQEHLFDHLPLTVLQTAEGELVLILKSFI